MQAPDLFSIFVHPLHRAGVRYMISGALASMRYGEPRLTLDVDLVVHLEALQAASFGGLFPEPDFIRLRPT